MRLAARVIHLLALLAGRSAAGLTGLERRLQRVLPAMLPPHQLATLTHHFYVRSYGAGPGAGHGTESLPLQPWEEDMIGRHVVPGATIVVLGAGLGRESLPLAHRGYRVLAVDNNWEGLRVAARRARKDNLPLSLVLADFHHLPMTAGQADCILMSSVMYSAIPGRARRQECLRRFQSALKPGGRIVLNFLVAGATDLVPPWRPPRIAAWLARLPGGNLAYQAGDTCLQGHFMHVFLDEAELRSELIDAGVSIVQLDWAGGVAVVA